MAVGVFGLNGPQYIITSRHGTDTAPTLIQVVEGPNAMERVHRLDKSMV